ncbi:MAG: hypothetical protein KKF89_01020, partial [Nanoarchaeota archaeon]|nr:hypothetical protein [Nanoarchaeota archaeon]MBU1854279.1 hypothetical protein [Nanoarchaeota archaeon]
EASPTTLESITSASVDYTGTHKCYDITGAQASWTWNLVTQINIHISGVKNQGSDNFYIYSDYLYAKVTYQDLDTTKPTIKSLDYPGNGDFVKTSIVDFNFTATDNDVINNCTLWGNFTPTWNKNKTTYDVQNNVETNITIRLDDGVYLWNVECYDNNGNSNFSSYNYTAKVDTTQPIVLLENPEDDNYTETSAIIFYFNVTDYITTISSCKLIVDNVTRDTTTESPVGESTTKNLTATLTSGDHYWWINCTDTNGWTNMSEIRNISVNVIYPTVQTILSTYEQGETATIIGENWNPNQIITINITLSNSSNYLFNTTSTGAGEINVDYNVTYDHASGLQNITAYQHTYPSDNATSDFTVTIRTADITIPKTNYYEGQNVTVNGSKFSINGTITINITYPGGNEVYSNLVGDDGRFNFTYNLSYTETLGLWNVSIYDSNYNNLNDTGNFTVNDRIANIYTDKNEYDAEETVYLNGTLFSSYGTVRVTIKNIDTDETSPGYPKDVAADTSGNITDNWYVNNTCAGNFSFNAYDLAHLELDDTTYFNITATPKSNDTTAISAYRNSPAGTVDIGLINESDDTRTSVTINVKSTDLYLEANWTNNYAEGTSIESVILTLEHYEEATNPVISVKWYDGSIYQTVSCPGIFITTTELNQTCDLSGYITDYTQANDISLRFVYRYSTGGATTGYIDQARLNITYSGQSACTQWGNTAPAINNMLITYPIDLLAGITKEITCNASIIDTEQDLAGVSATLYFNQNNSGDPDGNNDHYTNSSCSFSGTTAKIAVCGFQLWYYAKNGTWNCNMSATDTEFTDYDNITTTVNTLYAINITPTLLDYGNVPLGANSNNYTVNITNLGNMPLNVSVWGYGGSNSNETGGGLAFKCNQEGNITIGYEKYSINPIHNFNQKTNLTSGPKMIPIKIAKQTQPGIYVQNQTYWEINVKAENNPKGECNGTIIFAAEVS